LVNLNDFLIKIKSVEKAEKAAPGAKGADKAAPKK